jgi:hypothetical protein
MQSARAILHYHLLPVKLYRVFLNYLINDPILGEKVTEHKMCLDFLDNFFVCNISHSKKNSARYYHKRPVKSDSY